jgi:uncharacterized protein (TIGR02217 family)
MATYPASPIPSFSFSKEIGYRTLISNFENGAEQRRNKWSQGKRQFTLTYKTLTLTEVTVIWDFFVARKGSFESFDYVDPTTSTTYVVRFMEDKFTFEEFAYLLTSSGINMIQVL